MNVTCSKCSKTYALPDAAFVAGVHIRVRCKGCQNVFEVTQAPPAPPPGQPVAPSSAGDALCEVPESAISDPHKPPGEITKYFIAQSGASKRNPAWKIALFVVGGLGLPIGILSLLSSLSVVKLNVTRTNAEGETVEESFFSSAGVSGLKDLMTGEESRRREVAAKVKAEKAAKLAAQQAQQARAATPLDGPSRMGGTTGAVATGDPDMVGGTGPGGIGALRKDAVPKLRGVESATPAPATAGGLDEAVAGKVVGQSQPAFQGCIEEGLRRNPGMRVGKVSVVVLVAKSGVVKSASINPKQHESTNWGGCLVQRAKRMVFPPFEGDDEAEVQVPLVVGLGL
ncbi:MAG: family finger-like domain protein [Myxococcaceae bacterium]|nr:family finger-like domain protein [Myxococcaceae bacterium]